MSNCNTPATDADIEGIREGASEVYDSNKEPQKCQGAYWDLRLIAKIDALRSRVAEMEGALHDILTGVSLDWYVKEFSYHNREGGDSSGIISTIHNFETRNRVAAAFERGRQALASSGKDGK